MRTYTSYSPQRNHSGDYCCTYVLPRYFTNGTFVCGTYRWSSNSRLYRCFPYHCCHGYWCHACCLNILSTVNFAISWYAGVVVQTVLSAVIWPIIVNLTKQYILKVAYLSHMGDFKCLNVMASRQPLVFFQHISTHIFPFPLCLG